MTSDQKTAPTDCDAMSQGDQTESIREFPGQRWVNIGMRSVHLVGVAGIGGGFLFGLDESLWRYYWWLTLASGVVLSALYFWSNRSWPFQLKGATILFKLVLLGLGILWPHWRAELFVSIILISTFIAHSPRRVRGFHITKGHE